MPKEVLVLLADEVRAVGVLSEDLSALRLLDYLRVSRRVVRVNEVRSRDTTDGLRDTIAVTIICILNRAVV